MKVASIKKMAKEYDLNTLRQLEEEIVEGNEPHKPVEGEDEGDRLTNVSGAIWVLEQIEKNNSDIKTEVRNFTQRVRKSIS